MSEEILGYNLSLIFLLGTIQSDDPFVVLAFNFLREGLRDAAEKAWKRILDDADGNLPVYEKARRTDALGRILSHKSETI